ncbi:MAG: hypothetical protein ACREP9_02460, partial [Candidatus Dormibacteraceae bacterium]
MIFAPLVPWVEVKVLAPLEELPGLATCGTATGCRALIYIERYCVSSANSSRALLDAGSDDLVARPTPFAESRSVWGRGREGGQESHAFESRGQSAFGAPPDHAHGRRCPPGHAQDAGGPRGNHGEAR